MTTTGNSSPLALCIVIISTRASLRARFLVDVGQQRQLIDEARRATARVRGSRIRAPPTRAPSGSRCGLPPPRCAPRAGPAGSRCWSSDLAERDRDGLLRAPWPSGRRSGRETRVKRRECARRRADAARSACTSLAHSELFGRHRLQAGEQRRQVGRRSQAARPPRATP